MGLFADLFKSKFEKWVEQASLQELSDAYDEERLQWIKDGYNGGTAIPTPKMNRLNQAIKKRDEEEWENNPKRNRDPNSRWSDANRWEKD